MKKITIKFSSVVELWEFRNRVKATDVEINTSNSVIEGNFSDADIELAKDTFGAAIISESSAHQ